MYNYSYNYVIIQITLHDYCGKVAHTDFMWLHSYYNNNINNYNYNNKV